MKKLSTAVLCMVLVSSSLLFAGCDKKDKMSTSNKEKLQNVLLPKEKDNLVEFELYFDSSSSDKKTEVSKEERLIKKDELLGETIIQELIKGPTAKSKMKPVFPKSTRLASFSISDGIAYVDLSKEAQISMPAEKEETCLKALVLSLTQIESVEKVKITIEGKDAGTLGGNFDISKPLGKDDVKNARKR